MVRTVSLAVSGKSIFLRTSFSVHFVYGSSATRGSQYRRF
jgi:hypothetical protein